MIGVMLRVFSDPRCLLHRVPDGYPERAERLESILELLHHRQVEVEESGEHGGFEPAVAAVHSERYLSRFLGAMERGDLFLDTPDNPLCGSTWEAARAAVETTLAAADWVAAGAGRRGMSAVRPPGHHAERDGAMGFCYFNNVAVAVDYLRREKGAQRLAVVDFDVHHGNGTQHIFEEEPDVLYLSTHRYPFYPGTGAADERGTGDGEGATVNVPLPAGAGDVAFEAAFQSAVLPSLREFRPEILLISAGFDAWQSDPLGGMRVSEQGYRDWGRWLGSVSEEICEGRCLVLLEGGYDVQALPGLLWTHLQALDGQT
jgi:acetoin utilization deacetylase AcuC-like enzyme